MNNDNDVNDSYNENQPPWLQIPTKSSTTTNVSNMTASPPNIATKENQRGYNVEKNEFNNINDDQIDKESVDADYNIYYNNGVGDVNEY